MLPLHSLHGTSLNITHYYKLESTAVEQVVAFSLVMQRARVRSPVGTGFLGEVFSGFFLTCKTNVRKLQAPRSPNIIWPSLSSSLIIHYGHQRPEMLTRPKTLNIDTYKNDRRGHYSNIMKMEMGRTCGNDGPREMDTQSHHVGPKDRLEERRKTKKPDGQTVSNLQHEDSGQEWQEIERNGNN